MKLQERRAVKQLQSSEGGFVRRILLERGSRRGSARKIGGLTGCGHWQMAEGVPCGLGRVRAEGRPLGCFLLLGCRARVEKSQTSSVFIITDHLGYLVLG